MHTVADETHKTHTLTYTYTHAHTHIEGPGCVCGYVGLSGGVGRSSCRKANSTQLPPAC